MDGWILMQFDTSAIGMTIISRKEFVFHDAVVKCNVS